MKNKLIRLDRKVIRHIIKIFKLLAGIASIVKAFNLLAVVFDFIVGLFYRD
jgi:hypothetical protein